MLFKAQILERLASGEIDRVFRRWVRPTVRAGGTLMTAAGVIKFGKVDQVEEAAVSERDAWRAGFTDRDALLASLPPTQGQLYRIEILAIEADPRVALRKDPQFTPADRLAIKKRFRLWNANRRPGYGEDLLGLISRNESIAARELAAAVDVAVLKRDVRVLNGLGLTESLDVGYRLSPRGRTALVGLKV